MSRAGRIACIFTPMALTIASFITMIFVEIGGWSAGSSTLNDMYFMSANFTNLTTSTAGDLANTTELTFALASAQASGSLKSAYQIHLWNYCTANSSSSVIDWCSDRKSGFVFDPVDVWGLNATTTSISTGATSSESAIESEINSVKDSTEEFEDKVLGKTAADALSAYKEVAKWNFYAFETAFWTTLATVVVGLLAIFSRWGSLFTWILSVVSTILTFAAALTTTILYSTLTGALKALLHPYGIELTLGTHALAVTWIGTAFSVAATTFWLFSICCCSGRSNPHHKSNKGGLWNAEPKGQGYGDYGRSRGMRVEKTGGYERVSSPFLGADQYGDRVPLHDYPQPQPYGQHMQPGGAYEPFRHSHA